MSLMSRLAIVAVCALLVVMGSAPVWAQGKRARAAKPSEAQLELNQQGVEAIIAGEFDRAARLFQASLDLGELNITYVNKGRAHQKGGQCKQAEQAYIAALAAPRVAAPTHQQIEQAIANYRNEMASSCPGVLEVVCQPWEGARFGVDDGPTQACDGALVLVPQGPHVLRGHLQGKSLEQPFEIAPMQELRLELDLSALVPVVVPVPKVAVAPTASEPVVRDPGPAPARRSSVWAWGWMAGAGATLAAGVVLDMVPATASNQRFDGMDFVPLGLYAAGTGALVYGVTQLWD